MMKKTLCKTIMLLLFVLLLCGCTVPQSSTLDNGMIRYDVKMPYVGYEQDGLPGGTAVITPSPGTADTSQSADLPTTTAPGSTGRAFEDLAPTINMSFEELVGDNGNYDDIVGYPAPGTFHVIVDIYHQVVLVCKKDAQGAYTVPVRYMICSTGSGKNPTRRGTFETGNSKVRYGYFVNDHVYGQYWTHVVSRTYFHSLLYTQRDAATYTTSSYKNLGSNVSHGCIRLLVPDARWMYYHLAPGSTVEIRKGSKEDTNTAQIRQQLKRPSLPKTRPNLQMGTIPHTDNWDIDTYLSRYPQVVLVK